MSFGYLGDTSTKIKQAVKNQGVISVSEAYELEKKGQLTGSYELIARTVLSGQTDTEFTNLRESEFDTHVFQFEQIIMSGADTLRALVSNDGGTSYEGGSAYDGELQNVSADGGNSQQDRDGFAYWDRILQNQANVEHNGTLTVYNMGDATCYTSAHQEVQSRTSAGVGTKHGGHVYNVKETVNAIKFFLTSNTMTGAISVFGYRT